MGAKNRKVAYIGIAILVVFIIAIIALFLVSFRSMSRTPEEIFEKNDIKRIEIWAYGECHRFTDKESIDKLYDAFAGNVYSKVNNPEETVGFTHEVTIVHNDGTTTNVVAAGDQLEINNTTYRCPQGVISGITRTLWDIYDNYHLA